MIRNVDGVGRLACDVCEGFDVEPSNRCTGPELCETCLDLLLAMIAWAGQPQNDLERLKRLSLLCAAELDDDAIERWQSSAPRS